MTVDNSLVNSLLTILVIIDPFGNIPIFLSLTGDMENTQRRNTILKAVFIAASIIILFSITGDSILSYFGVSTNAFSIAGGMLLLVIGFEMVLKGATTHSRQVEEIDRDSVYITPLATPLLAGPGSMTAGLLLVQREGLNTAIPAITIALIISLLVLLNCNLIFRIIGKDGSTVLSKIMGLLVTSIAVQMILNGLVGSFYTLAKI